ncbi:MAG: hypothetical protein Q8P72_07150 [Candidatus Roizmanbacteria bacterium]|nr:hypothetical protein [Candidatus Roizmanbacteria bacterium]
MNDDQTHKKQLLSNSDPQQSAQPNNHTPVDHLIKQNTQSVTISKEGEPIEIAIEKKEPQEIEFIDTEPEIEDKEVEKFVEVVHDDFEIHPDLKKAGLQSVDHASLDSKHKVQLPISDEKVIEGLHKPVTSSLRWLAEVAMFMLKQAHLTLKQVHGKVIRVLQR